MFKFACLLIWLLMLACIKGTCVVPGMVKIRCGALRLSNSWTSDEGDFTVIWSSLLKYSYSLNRLMKGVNLFLDVKEWISNEYPESFWQHIFAPRYFFQKVYGVSSMYSVLHNAVNCCVLVNLPYYLSCLCWIGV